MSSAARFLAAFAAFNVVFASSFSLFVSVLQQPLLASVPLFGASSFTSTFASFALFFVSSLL